jgi:hypothetical protein
VVRRARGFRPASRFQRWLRRAARVAVAAFAIVALFGGTGVAQAVAATMFAAPVKCACEHELSKEPTIDALCRCCTRDRGAKDGLAGSCCSTAVAPAAATPLSHADVVAAAACVGLIDDAYTSPLLGRSAELDLDRPPRA